MLNDLTANANSPEGARLGIRILLGAAVWFGSSEIVQGMGSPWILTTALSAIAVLFCVGLAVGGIVVGLQTKRRAPIVLASVLVALPIISFAALSAIH